MSQLSKNAHKFWDLVKKCRESRLICNYEVRIYRLYRNHMSDQYLSQYEHELYWKYSRHLSQKLLKTALLRERIGRHSNGFKKAA